MLSWCETVGCRNVNNVWVADEWKVGGQDECGDKMEEYM